MRQEEPPSQLPHVLDSVPAAGWTWSCMKQDRGQPAKQRLMPKEAIVHSKHTSEEIVWRPSLKPASEYALHQSVRDRRKVQGRHHGTAAPFLT